MSKLQEILAEFDTELKGTYTRKDGSSFDYKYRAKLLDDGTYIVIEQDKSDRGFDDEGYPRGCIELGGRKSDSTWSGIGSVSVYGPQLAWSHEDIASPAPASVNISTASGDATTARNHALMIVIAADLAEAWTERDRAQLEELAAEKRATYQRQRAEEERQRSELMAIACDVRETIFGADRVRVTVDDRKNPVVLDACSVSDALDIVGQNQYSPYSFIGRHVTKIEYKAVGETQYHVAYERG